MNLANTPALNNCPVVRWHNLCTPLLSQIDWNHPPEKLGYYSQFHYHYPAAIPHWRRHSNYSTLSATPQQVRQYSSGSKLPDFCHQQSGLYTRDGPCKSLNPLPFA